MLINGLENADINLCRLGSIEINKSDDARDLLGQCQEGVIRLGKLIEARKGDQYALRC